MHPVSSLIPDLLGIIVRLSLNFHLGAFVFNLSHYQLAPKTKYKANGRIGICSFIQTSHLEILS